MPSICTWGVLLSAIQSHILMQPSCLRPVSGHRTGHEEVISTSTWKTLATMSCLFSAVCPGNNASVISCHLGLHVNVTKKSGLPK